METTTGSTYRLPSLNGPVEPINRQFYKTQRWNLVQDVDLERGQRLENLNTDSIHELNLYRTGTNPSGLFKLPGRYTFYNTSRQKGIWRGDATARRRRIMVARLPTAARNAIPIFERRLPENVY